MADVRESFPTLEDGSGVGTALAKVQEGDTVAAKNGSLALSFKDASGNAVAAPVSAAGTAVGAAIPVLAGRDESNNLTEINMRSEGDAVGRSVAVVPFKDDSGNYAFGRVDALGNLRIVTPDAAVGNGKQARGTASGNASLTTVATITLTTDKIYSDLEFIVSCFRDSIFQIILSDDGVETILAEALCGPGQLTVQGSLKAMEVTAGASGVQLLLVKAKNLSTLSDFRASICVVEYEG